MKVGTKVHVQLYNTADSDGGEGRPVKTGEPFDAVITAVEELWQTDAYLKLNRWQERNQRLLKYRYTVRRVDNVKPAEMQVWSYEVRRMR